MRSTSQWKPDSAQEAEAAVAFNVRLMEPGDLPAVVAIDKKHSRRERRDFIAQKYDACVHAPGINTSLLVEADHTPVGFLFGQLFFGEFGIPATRAVLDTIGVQPGFARSGVGRALISQYRMNLQALRVGTIGTLVDWQRGDLIAFFRSMGFRPSRSTDLVWDTQRYRFAGTESAVRVRRATEQDLAVITAIGEESGLPSQSKYFATKLAAAKSDPANNLFIVAGTGKEAMGFMVGSLFRGEFGIDETRGVIDVIAVKEAHQHQGVASAIVANLLQRVRALNVGQMETLVRWNNWPLLRFLEYVGFRPSTRLSLEWDFNRNGG